MVAEQISVDVNTIPELAALTEKMQRDHTTVLLTRDGETIATLNPVPIPAQASDEPARRVPRLADPKDIWKDYDPVKVLDGMRKAQGAFAGVDIKQLIEDIYAQRGQDSSGRPGG